MTTAPLAFGSGAVLPAEAIYVTGLIVLLAFASLEFLFFIGLASKGEPEP